MTLTGIDIDELTTGGAEPPESIEYKQAFIAGHATLRGFSLLDITTDCESVYGAGELADQLETVQLNSNSQFWGVVYCINPVEMTAALIADHIKAVADGHDVSTITIFHDADKAFADAVKNAYTAQALNKKDFEFVLQYRKSYIYDLTGVEAVQGSGSLVIPLPAANKVAVDDEILITRAEDSSQLFGRFVVTARTDTSCTITSTQATFTFLAGAYLKEHPDDYCMRADDEFDLYNCNAMSIVAPYTQDNHLGAYTGRISKTKVHSSAGKVIDGELKNVDVDPDLSLTHFSLLDSGRFVFLKRFPERKTQVHINDDNVMFPAGDTVKTMATRRVLNKCKRQIRHFGFDLINDDSFDKNEAGAKAAALIAGKGLRIMKKPGGSLQPEITDFTIVGSWTPEGGIEFLFSVTDKNRIKHGGGTVTISAPTSE